MSQPAQRGVSFTLQADELLADLPELLRVVLAPGLPRGLLLLAVAVVPAIKTFGQNLTNIYHLALSSHSDLGTLERYDMTLLFHHVIK